MKDSFEHSLLEAGSLMKKGYRALVDNAGKAIAAITLVVCALVLFTDISFSDFNTESFTGTLAVMLTASYLMYFSMNEAGERLGEESEQYLKAKEEFDRLRAGIKGEEICRLREFCKKYSEEELAYRRENLLFYYGYTGADYEAYRKEGKCEGRRARRAFLKAERLRAVSLTPKALLEGERYGTKSELTSPEQGRIARMLVSLIPTTLGMIVTVSVMLTAKENLNAATVIDGIFKLASLPVIGFRGYVSGYNYARETRSLWLRTKSRLLEAFLKS